MSGPAGVIQWSDVVCSAPFLHARYPAGDHSCKADKQKVVRASGGRLIAGGLGARTWPHAGRAAGQRHKPTASASAAPRAARAVSTHSL